MKQDHWAVDLGQGMGVIRLGVTRQDVVSELVRAGIDLEGQESDGEGWLYVDDMDSVLKFKTTNPPVLLEIVVEDERLRLGPLGVIGERLHKIVEALQVPDAETLWRKETDDEKEERSTNGEQPLVTDETLLDEGTLWIPSLGLGLGMVRGEITTVRLRQPGESPRRGLGTLTPAQRELSARKDLPTYLVRRPATASPPGSWINNVLFVGVALAMGLLVWKGVDYQRRWNASTMVEGDVVDVKPPPPDPFPDAYTIEYRDSAGAQHKVTLKRNDVYVTAHVGEKVEIRFLPEAPDRPLGPARYRDAAFEKYIPWGIGIMAGYFVLQAVVSVAGIVLRGRRRPV